MNFIKSAIVKLVARHVANWAGAWLVTKGILSGDEQEQVIGAVMTLAAVGHSLWDKRELVKKEIKTLIDGPALVLAIALPALVLTGCKGAQMVKTSHVKGFNWKLLIPIPFTGASITPIVDMSMQFGVIDDANIFQPASTNGPVYVPNLAINMGQRDTAALSTAFNSSSTNANIGANAGDTEHFTVITGEGEQTTNSLTSGK